MKYKRKINNKYLICFSIILVCFVCLILVFSQNYFSTKIFAQSTGQEFNYDINYNYEKLKKQNSECDKYTISQYNYSASSSDSYYCLKDKYMFVTENQDNFGLCWDFAASKALSNFYAVKTGQIYDFSEAWIALCCRVKNSGYVLGDGGTFSNYYTLASEYGLLLEDEFPYEMLYNIDNSNYLDVYNEYKNLANTTYLEGIKQIGFYGQSESERLISVKNYILSNGALSISVSWDYAQSLGGYYYVCTNNVVSSNGHSIALIGWDDNISFTDTNGNLRTGAYIALNSWGTSGSGIIYISYEDAWSAFSIFGYDYNTTQKDINVSINASNSNFYNYESGQYKNNGGSVVKTTFEDKNIFSYGEDLDITYSYVLSSAMNINNVSCDIFFNDESAQNLFSTFTLNKTLKTLHLITTSNIDSGTYKLKFYADVDGDGNNDKTYVCQIFVFSGADMNSISVDKVKQCFNTICSTEKENNIYGYTNNNFAFYYFYMNLYCSISNIILPTYASINSNSTYTLASNEKIYSSGRVVIKINNLTQYKRTKTTINFETIYGNIVTYNLITYKISANDKKVYAFYNLDGGINNQNNDKYTAIGENYSSYQITAPIKSGFELENVYTDKSKTISINSSNGYYISNDNVTSVTGTNIANSGQELNYVCLYFSWVVPIFHFNNQILMEKFYYGDEIEKVIEGAKNGSNNYTYTLVSSSLPNGVIFFANTLKIYGTPTECGDFSIIIKAKDNTLNDEINATISFTISKREITYKIDDKNSVYGQALKELTGSITAGNLIDGDNLNIQLSCDITKFSNINTDFAITGTYSNANYQLIFIDGTYRLNGAEIDCSITGYNSQYDGERHFISVVFNKEIANKVVKYSLTNSNYSENQIEFTNFTNGAKTIYVEISASGYTTKYLQSTINITKKVVNIVWSNTKFEYNGQTQNPSFTIETINENETDNFMISSGKVEVGNYQATISASDNYDIQNSSINFEITKIITKLEPITLNINLKSGASALKDVELPEGYHWVNENQELTNETAKYMAYYVPIDLEHYSTINNIEITIDRTTKPNYTIIIIFASVIGTILSVVFVFAISHKKIEKANREKREKTTIQFVSYCDTTIEPMDSKKRISATLPVIARKGYKFDGWYTDKIFMNKYISNGANNEIKLYAKWMPDIDTKYK